MHDGRRIGAHDRYLHTDARRVVELARVLLVAHGAAVVRVVLHVAALAVGHLLAMAYQVVGETAHAQHVRDIDRRLVSATQIVGVAAAWLRHRRRQDRGLDELAHKVGLGLRDLLEIGAGPIAHRQALRASNERSQSVRRRASTSVNERQRCYGRYVGLMSVRHTSS